MALTMLYNELTLNQADSAFTASHHTPLNSQQVKVNGCVCNVKVVITAAAEDDQLQTSAIVTHLAYEGVLHPLQSTFIGKHQCII